MIHKLKTKIWSSKLRIRTGEVVQHKNSFYSNKTGINSEPEMNSNSNWLYIGEVEKDGSFILRSGENLTEQEIIHLQEILGIGNNLDIGFAADGTLNNGFDVPMEKVSGLVFNQLDFEYELDEENGVILIKKIEGANIDLTNIEKTSYKTITLPFVAQEEWKGFIVYFSGTGNLTMPDTLSDGWTINAITEIGCSLTPKISGTNAWAFDTPSTVFQKQIFTVTKKLTKIYLLGF